MLYIALGALAGLLLASVLINVFQYRIGRVAVKAALQHEERLLDRARATELRSDRQIDAMLARLSTAPRLELSEGEAAATVDLSERTFISDLPVDDVDWNELRGEDTIEDDD
jgi:uncharacterized membrane protein YccC